MTKVLVNEYLMVTMDVTREIEIQLIKAVPSERKYAYNQSAATLPTNQNQS